MTSQPLRIDQHSGFFRSFSKCLAGECGFALALQDRGTCSAGCKVLLAGFPGRPFVEQVAAGLRRGADLAQHRSWSPGYDEHRLIETHVFHNAPHAYSGTNVALGDGKRNCVGVSR